MQLSLYSNRRGYESDFFDFDGVLSDVGKKVDRTQIPCTTNQRTEGRVLINL